MKSCQKFKVLLHFRPKTHSDLYKNKFKKKVFTSNRNFFLHLVFIFKAQKNCFAQTIPYRCHKISDFTQIFPTANQKILVCSNISISLPDCAQISEVWGQLFPPPPPASIAMEVITVMSLCYTLWAMWHIKVY